MTNSFSFAITLHRAFDSEPPKAKAVFYSESKQLYPIEKPNGLYVFLEGAENPLTIICAGFKPESINISAGNIAPVALYPNSMFAAPTGWKLIRASGDPEKFVYCIDTRYELKLAEYTPEKGFARIRSRKGLTGGCLLFSTNIKKEIALILEKQSPDRFYLNGLSYDYSGGTVQRVFCARTDAQGKYYLAVPESFMAEAVDYI